jgi:hypothetical protein
MQVFSDEGRDAGPGQLRASLARTVAALADQLDVDALLAAADREAEQP